MCKDSLSTNKFRGLGEPFPYIFLFPLVKSRNGILHFFLVFVMFQVVLIIIMSFMLVSQGLLART